ncbi:MAG TPA: hypothetical protein VNV42_00100 [Solirubrobacteraceae bacterium]|nr:hypothetical protein [Solirubrobacteraceae bacterium]
MDAWTFIWLMFALKIPIVGLFLIVRWAVRQGPEPASEGDGGIGVDPRPLHPHHPRHPRPRRPGPARRGPHRESAAAPAPARIRVAAARARQSQR